MKQGQKKRLSAGKICIVLGLVLIFGAAGLYGYNLWVDYQAGLQSDAAALALVESIQGNGMDLLDVEDGFSAERLQVAEMDGAYYMGVLTIPALEKILPVQSDWSMTKLKTSPCRYSGTLLGGEFVIAGHNYKRHFSGISTLSIGDSIVFTDLEGKQTFYEVKEIYTVAATDIEGMVNSGYDLSLFTCNYGGKARVTVRCERIAVPEA